MSRNAVVPPVVASVTRLGADALRRSEPLRYVLNGILASVVHFSVFMLNLGALHLPSAALANLIASVFGIATSFVGNRYFVFRTTGQPLGAQMVRFGGLYAAVAAIHTVTLWLWTDLGGLDYHFGFLVAVALQLGLSFAGNKTLVFTR